MGKKVGLTLEDVVGAAAAIADRDGLEATTLRVVADELGIKTPSLYNHVAGLPGLRRQLAMYAAERLTELFAETTMDLEPTEAIRAAAAAYSAFASSHPGLYAALLPAPTAEEDPELYEAMAAPVAVLAGKLGELGIEGDRAIHMIRAVRALLHGFADLGAKQGFGMAVDLESSYEHAVEAMITSLSAT